MDCEVHATLTTEGGSTGKITKFEIKKCIEPFGSFKTTKCELNIGEGRGLPWTVDVKETDLVVTNWHVKHTFKGAECKQAELDKTISSMTVTLGPEPKEIKELVFDGKITGKSRRKRKTSIQNVRLARNRRHEQRHYEIS